MKEEYRACWLNENNKCVATIWRNDGETHFTWMYMENGNIEDVDHSHSLRSAKATLRELFAIPSDVRFKKIVQG
jgi:hypothetical protein